MTNYEILVIDKNTKQFKRMTLEHLKADLDALSETSAMRVAAEPEGTRLSDLPAEMPGRDALIARFGPDYRVLTTPPDFPDSDDAVVEYNGQKFALLDGNGQPDTGAD